MFEIIKEALICVMFYITILLILPVVMHKILYIFAKITYKIHKMRINKK